VDNLSSKSRSYNMSRIRSKNTSPERVVFSLFRKTSIPFRKHYSKAPGKPDLAFLPSKTAVFIHGCFWHGCPRCKPPKPKSNKDYWNKKLKRTKERDEGQIKLLKKCGWKTIVIWECQIKNNPDKQISRIIRVLR